MRILVFWQNCYSRVLVNEHWVTGGQTEANNNLNVGFDIKNVFPLTSIIIFPKERVSPVPPDT